MMEKMVEATNPNAFFKGRASTVTTRKKPSLDIEHTSDLTPAAPSEFQKNCFCFNVSQLQRRSSRSQRSSRSAEDGVGSPAHVLQRAASNRVIEVEEVPDKF